MCRMMQFFHSTISFWWGMFVIVSCFRMLSCWQKVLRVKDKNSLPWSIWSTLITKLVSFLIWFFGILNLSNVHVLFNRKKTHVFKKWSCIEIKKYFNPPKNECLNIQQRSTCIISFCLDVPKIFSLGTLDSCSFLKTQQSQTYEVIGIQSILFVILQPNVSHFAMPKFYCR